MSFKVSVLASSQLTSLDMRPDDDVRSASNHPLGIPSLSAQKLTFRHFSQVQAVKNIMEERIKESRAFSNTPLPAPMLALRGQPLKDETKLSALNLSSGDHLVFLYPVRQ